jgi:hypothetical protein
MTGTCPHCQRPLEVTARTPLDALRADGTAPHVVEQFVAPLWGVLQGNPSAALVQAYRTELSGFSDAALAEAARTVRQTRTRWPSVKQAYAAAQAAQPRHMVRIEPGSTAWAAWMDHWGRQGNRVLVRLYRDQGFAKVQRQFPPVGGEDVR